MTLPPAPPPAPPLESWRVFFPAAAGLVVTGLSAWAVQLSGVDLGISPRDHAAFMIWGALGAGVQGFLMTAYAKQNDAPLPPMRWLAASLVAHVTGAALLLLRGLIQPPTWLFALGALLPWGMLTGWALTVAGPSLRRRWEATTASVPVALLAAIVGLSLHLDGAPMGVQVGVHGFIAPLALAILDRVLPFFSSRAAPGYTGVRRPWFLGPLFAVTAARLALEGGGVTGWPLSALHLATLALLLRQWHGWQPWPAAKTPMIAVIHVGVGWFVLAEGLALAHPWAAWTGLPPSAATHALAVGGLGSLLLGISMRVVRGHGGLPMVLGRVGAGAMAALQAAALLRVGAGVLGPAWGWTGSALLLIGVFAAWFARFGPVCWGWRGSPNK